MREKTEESVRGGEPTALVQAREAYKAKVKAAIEPITADYSNQLDKLLKSCCAMADLRSALAVQNEIASHSVKAGTNTIVGKWTWYGRENEFVENGIVMYNGDGRQKARKYRIVGVREDGQTGLVDLLTVSPDGSTLAGRNSNDHVYTGKRTTASPSALRSRGKRTSRKGSRRCEPFPIEPRSNLPGYRSGTVFRCKTLRSSRSTQPDRLQNCWPGSLSE